MKTSLKTKDTSRAFYCEDRKNGKHLVIESGFDGSYQENKRFLKPIFENWMRRFDPDYQVSEDFYFTRVNAFHFTHES